MHGMAIIERLSKAEAIKQQSRQLRGNLALDLVDTPAPFDNDAYSRLKFHGVYQGYDRDSATERKQRGDDKLWQFMVRSESRRESRAVPGLRRQPADHQADNLGQRRGALTNPTRNLLSPFRCLSSNSRKNSAVSRKNSAVRPSSGIYF
jgi:hypothetical protein